MPQSERCASSIPGVFAGISVGSRAEVRDPLEKGPYFLKVDFNAFCKRRFSGATRGILTLKLPRGAPQAQRAMASDWGVDSRRQGPCKGVFRSLKKAHSLPWSRVNPTPWKPGPTWSRRCRAASREHAHRARFRGVLPIYIGLEKPHAHSVGTGGKKTI